jgi:aryl-alcohol dehydrogenase-like predicted oxidoreductase
MCEAEGMGIVPWGALGSGNYKTEEQRQSLKVADCPKSLKPTSPSARSWSRWPKRKAWS